MIPRHLLSSSDFEWFLDHSFRLYLITPDEAYGYDEDGQPLAARIIPRDGGPHVVVPVEADYFYGFQDTDKQAEDLLAENLRDGTARLRRRVLEADNQQSPRRSPDSRTDLLDGEEA